MVRRLPILWLCLALLVASCRGDSADDPLDAPPWGLDHIDMPDTEERWSQLSPRCPRRSAAGLDRAEGLRV